MTIVAKTSFTQIGSNKEVSPQSVLWVIVNDGESILYINDQFRLKPGERWGIDSSLLVPPPKDFRNDTVFRIRFITEKKSVIQTIEDIDTVVQVDKLKSAQLIETNYSTQ